MENTFGQMVREERERRGLSQVQLAEMAHTTQQSIDRIERDAVSRSRSAPEVAAVLGIPFPLSAGSQQAAAAQATKVVPKADLVGGVDLPIYASVRGGAVDDSLLVSPEPIDYVKRPEPLARAKNGYGLYVVGDSMEPAFRQGDLALIHPNIPPTAGDEVVVCSIDVNGDHYAVLKQLTKVTAEKWHLKQYNPPHGEPAEFTLDRKEWPVCHLVVGSYRKR
ncbi:S24 family peptidase [Sinorhizobium sojae]|nr:S24 family peptidase [Sinorhizobium sojae]